MNPIWRQEYSVWGLGLGISAIIAALPTALLLFLLAVRRKAAWIAALAGLGATLAVALAAYRMPAKLALSSAAYGAAFGLFPISWIVFWAIALYNVTVATGKFEIIRESIGALTSDLRVQALIIAFAFGAFIEGAAGFGTPVAVAGAMMAGLGFSPYYASALCLVANTVPVAFGSIGIPIVTLSGVTGLPFAPLSAIVGRLCAPISFLLPAYLIAIVGGAGSALEVWPAVLTAGGVFACVQFCVSNYVGAQLTDILSSLSAMGALVLLLRVWKPRAGRRDRFAEKTSAASSLEETEPRIERTTRTFSAGETIEGWVPYALLVICVLLWGYKPLLVWLNKVTFVVPWPALHNLILRSPPVVAAPSLYAATFNLNLLSASGSACMVATLISAAFLRMPLSQFAKLLVATARQLIYPTITVSAVLSLAFVMNYSGATGTLGLAFAATGAAFPFFSPFLGWLGVFLTGSDTSSNALFGALQVVTARRLGFNPVLVAAANSAGGVMGKMISLQSIAVAAAATGISVKQQAKLLRFTLKHSLFLAGLVGLEVLLYAYVYRLH
ncbi:MAG TPA: lactate permease LctP family transporter [Acidobacteriaceae bacterium]|jgi:lactate permease|nr:lactate permease LctP family transporter [Acidobacteriaceae bacterium]